MQPFREEMDFPILWFLNGLRYMFNWGDILIVESMLFNLNLLQNYMDLVKARAGAAALTSDKEISRA